MKKTTLAAVGLPLLYPKNSSTNVFENKKYPICMFSKHLQFLDYSEMAETMRESGLDGVDLTVRPGGHVLPEKVERDLPKAVEAIKKADLEIPMMTTKITDPTDKTSETILKTASNLGIKYYRMGYLRYDDSLGIEKSIEKHKNSLKKLAELNEKYNIHGAYQNHAGTRIGGPVWDVWMLLKGLDPEFIGCQYDIRHAVLEGGYSWELGLKLIKDYIKCIVVKDFVWKQTDRGWRGVSVPLQEGMVDFNKYFGYLNSFGYEGPVSLHFEFPIYPDKNATKSEKKKHAIKTISKDVSALKSMLKESNLISK